MKRLELSPWKLLRTYLQQQQSNKAVEKHPASLVEAKKYEQKEVLEKNECLYELLNLDLSFYQDQHADLSEFSVDQLKGHYFEHGYWEGRMNDSIAVRENFLASLNRNRMLEIGPFCHPCLTAKKVDYADILSTTELKERAEKIGLSSRKVPKIKYVLKGGRLDCIEDRYDLVFSSHNLEHQPDLIAHLNEVSSILNKDGCFALIVPNARYCFDASLPLTKISEIFTAHQEKRRVHSLGSVIEHYAMTTHNDAGIHWIASTASDAPSQYNRIDPQRVGEALKAYHEAKGLYLDVHAWQFDPISLSEILNCLIKLKMIDFSKVVCNGPVAGRNEFTLIIEK